MKAGLERRLLPTLSALRAVCSTFSASLRGYRAARAAAPVDGRDLDRVQRRTTSRAPFWPASDAPVRGGREQCRLLVPLWRTVTTPSSRDRECASWSSRAAPVDAAVLSQRPGALARQYSTSIRRLAAWRLAEDHRDGAPHYGRSAPTTASPPSWARRAVPSCGGCPKCSQLVVDLKALGRAATCDVRRAAGRRHARRTLTNASNTRSERRVGAHCHECCGDAIPAHAVRPKKMTAGEECCSAPSGSVLKRGAIGNADCGDGFVRSRRTGAQSKPG